MLKMTVPFTLLMNVHLVACNAEVIMMNWLCWRCPGWGSGTRTSWPWTATRSSRTRGSRRSWWKRRTRGRCRSSTCRRGIVASTSARSAWSPSWVTSSRSTSSVSTVLHSRLTVLYPHYNVLFSNVNLFHSNVRVLLPDIKLLNSPVKVHDSNRKELHYNVKMLH